MGFADVHQNIAVLGGIPTVDFIGAKKGEGVFVGQSVPKFFQAQGLLPKPLLPKNVDQLAENGEFSKPPQLVFNLGNDEVVKEVLTGALLIHDFGEKPV